MNNFLKLWLAAFLLSGFWVQAQVNTRLSDSLQKILNSYYNPDSMPGISAAVMVNNEGIWQGAVGESHSGTAMDTSMLLGIGSNTKLFTSVLMLKFQEQGLLSIDDSLYHWLPNYSNIDSTITIRQLLQHQSGLDDYVKDQTFFNHFFNTPNKVWTNTELLSFVGAPAFAAGTSVEYCNTNFLLAGMILENVSGLPYDQLVRDSIITPLGLQHTFLEGFEPVVGTMAHPWFLGTDYASTPRTSVGTYSSAAGCIVAKPSDMVKWYNALFKGGYASGAVLSELTSFINYPGASFDLGLGLMRYQHGGQNYWGHGGQTIGYLSYFYYDPNCQNSVAIIINKTYHEIQQLAADLSEMTCAMAVTTEEVSLSRPSFKLYPNPSSQQLTIEAPEGTENFRKILISRISGEIIFQKKGDWPEVIRINTSDWAEGEYIVQVETDGGVYSEKLVLCHP